MDCSAMVFIDEFLNFFNIICLLLMLGWPDCLSSSADTLPALKRECHSETTVQLKEFLQKPHEACQAFQ
jgi:hypothetical protein